MSLRHPVHAFLALAILTVPCQAAHWVEVGNAETSTDKVMVDVDSIATVDAYRVANIMTLFPAPRTNVHNITLDRRIQRAAFDCNNHRVALIRTLGYLGEKQVGASPENTDWKGGLKPLRDDPTDERAFKLVCTSSSAGTPAAPASPPKPKVGFGSGIVVDDQGDVLTNSHVVKQCKSIAVANSDAKSLPAKLVGVDPKNDLALVKIAYDAPLGEAARFRPLDEPAKLGESVGVIGYPLPGYLSTEPKVTFGQVNSVAGVNNDYTLLQISAPLQPGNSGGPVFDAYGQVIGVVVAEASLAVLASSGALPQNVNFAIRGEVAQIFLTARGIKVLTTKHRHALSTEAVASQGLRSTVQVICAIE